MPEAQYPIRAVSKLTGISIDTLRAWERRYAAVVPERSERGRQYSQEQIQRLVLLHSLVERGHAIGQIASLPKQALRDLLETEPPRKSEHAGSPTTAEPLIVPFLDALTHFDHTRVNDELGRLAALLTPRDLIYRVALPIMREVGERWHKGEFGIAQEHLASAALRSIFGSLVRIHPAQPGSKKIVMGTLSGDFHDFGVLSAAMIAAINGLDPIFLGANLPALELAEAAKISGADIVLAGYTASGSAEIRDIAALAKALPPGTDLWIGGPNLPELDTQALPVGVRLAYFSSLEEFEKQCRRVNKIV